MKCNGPQADLPLHGDFMPTSQPPDDFWQTQAVLWTLSSRRVAWLAWLSLILALIASPIIVLPSVMGLDWLLWHHFGWGSSEKDAITRPIWMGLPILSLIVTASARAWNTSTVAKGCRRLTTVALILNVLTFLTYLVVADFLVLLASGWE